ncbi:ABC transporter permease [Glycomyces harbinensis]|uniref:ABC-2 type transport system permease protein n=1 Tax=Glycomyces harbinensis TaxID=58114 RepID=A0A1G6XNW5_9ACTN|nr:ABC transporter permease [Glycomyces harbinensis]SDD79884.1 ABC-2 type transport system permease protein [Glycomyces harbinensis]
MTGLLAALRVETRKAAAALVLRVGGASLALGTAVLAAALVAAVETGNEQIAAKLGTFAEAAGWDLLIAIATQVVAAGALLAFGTTLGWSFGREFTDGTINGLPAIPVSRAATVAAKLLVHLMWTVIVAVSLVCLLIAAGLATGLGALDAPAAASLARLFALTLLTGLIATPAAWAATLGRGPLPGVTAAVALIVTAQIAVVAFPAQGAWLPIAAPALWAMQPTAVTGVQLLLAPVFALAFTAVTVSAWRRLQLDR